MSVRRDEVLRVLHRLTVGHPELTPADLNDAPLSAEELGLAFSAGSEDLELLNSCLAVEAEHRADQFAALEQLLGLTAWYDGDLDERLRALCPCGFAQAADALYTLGWIDVPDAG